MAPTIQWNENTPAGADSAGLGPNEIKSLKTALRNALDSEHNFPATGGDAGAHRLGSGRPYVDVQSMVSSTGTDGRLLHTSDTSRLFGVGSGGTSLIGGATALLAGAFPGTAPQRHYWATEFGADVTNGTSGVVAVTIPNSGYSGVPYVVVTPTNSFTASAIRVLQVYSKTATVFNVAAWNVSNNSVAMNFDWISIGTRVL